MSPYGEEGEVVEVATNELSSAHGAQINFGDLTSYLIYAWDYPYKAGYYLPHSFF
jgi:hypothetical protein